MKSGGHVVEIRSGAQTMKVTITLAGARSRLGEKWKRPSRNAPSLYAKVLKKDVKLEAEVEPLRTNDDTINIDNEEEKYNPAIHDPVMYCIH